MNRLWLKIFAFTGVFVLAALIIFLSSGSSDEKEISYTALGESELPIVTLKVDDYSLNTLWGYTADTDAGQAQEALAPIDENRTIGFSVKTLSENITGIEFEVRSIDGMDLVEKTALENWEVDQDRNVTGQIKIQDIIKEGVEYRVVLKLSTERTKDISYYFRTVYGKNMKTREMLGYVFDFHASTFDEASMEKYAINWEVDGTRDDENLAYVDIHSSFKQLTYRNLPVSQIGEAQVTLLDMDESFGSFRIDSLLKAENEYGGYDYYTVSEFICLQWTSQRFYLMKYERRMNQTFAWNHTIENKRINFGIINEEEVPVLTSPDNTKLAFVVNDELWSYNRDSGELTELFSMAGNEKEIIRHNYGIKIIDITDNGEVFFFVYGYMRRGAHEGGNGLSCYYYNPETENLTETIYISTASGYEEIGCWLNTLGIIHGDQIYFLFDDTVYSMDRFGQEVVRMVEEAEKHNLVVNENQEAVAWTYGGNGSYGDQVRIRYINSDETISLEAETGEYIISEGFVDSDFIATFGKISEISKETTGLIYPRYALTVTDNTGKEIARYEKDDLYIMDILVGNGKITLKRASKNGEGFEKAEDDVLMQNYKEVEKTESIFKNEINEVKRRVFYYKCTSTENVKKITPGRVAPYEGELSGQGNDYLKYYAYATGRLQGIYETAGEAILAVNDDMGFVTATGGYRVWNRTAKRTYKTSLKLPEELTAKKYLTDDGTKIITDLEGCTLRQILRFIDKGSFVFFYGEDGGENWITAYDPSNVWIYNVASGETLKYGQEDAARIIIAAGSRFISYIGK